jgi:hypothetical protein
MSNDFHIIDDTPDEPEVPAEDDRLNLTRIRAIAHDRRAAYRRLFWARAIVFLFACLAVMTGVDAFRADGTRRLWFAGATLVFGVLGVRAALRLRRFTLKPTEESPPRPDPTAFASLSDGGQFARRLDELSRDR